MIRAWPPTKYEFRGNEVYVQGQKQKRPDGSDLTPKDVIRDWAKDVNEGAEDRREFERRYSHACPDTLMEWAELAAMHGVRLDGLAEDLIPYAVCSTLEEEWIRLHLNSTPASPGGAEQSDPASMPGSEKAPHEPPPEGVWQALFRPLWRLRPWLKWLIIILTAALLVLFALYEALPEAYKQELLDWITKQL